MTSVYPSINELMPPVYQARIPMKLANEIRERYETMGGKYLTDQLHVDGRPVNGMMYTDRIQNCLEEVIDAVFCILGWIFKTRLNGVRPPDNALCSLDYLIRVYTILTEEQSNGTVS